MLPHEEQSGRFLNRPQQAYPAATVAEFCTAVPIWSDGKAFDIFYIAKQDAR